MRLSSSEGGVQVANEGIPCQESFVGGQEISKLGYRILVFDRDLLIRTQEGKELRFQAARKLKKFLYDEGN